MPKQTGTFVEKNKHLNPTFVCSFWLSICKRMDKICAISIYKPYQCTFINENTRLSFCKNISRLNMYWILKVSLLNKWSISSLVINLCSLIKCNFYYQKQYDPPLAAIEVRQNLLWWHHIDKSICYTLHWWIHRAIKMHFIVSTYHFVFI